MMNLSVSINIVWAELLRDMLRHNPDRLIVDSNHKSKTQSKEKRDRVGITLGEAEMTKTVDSARDSHVCL